MQRRYRKVSQSTNHARFALATHHFSKYFQTKWIWQLNQSCSSKRKKLRLENQPALKNTNFAIRKINRALLPQRPNITTVDYLTVLMSSGRLRPALRNYPSQVRVPKSLGVKGETPQVNSKPRKSPKVKTR